MKIPERRADMMASSSMISPLLLHFCRSILLLQMLVKSRRSSFSDAAEALRDRVQPYYVVSVADNNTDNTGRQVCVLCILILLCLGPTSH